MNENIRSTGNDWEVGHTHESPKYIKGQIVTDGVDEIVITDVMVLEQPFIENRKPDDVVTRSIVYRGMKVGFCGPLLMPEDRIMFPIEQEADMWNRSKIK
jgi:hypothetical protein